MESDEEDEKSEDEESDVRYT